MWLKYSNCTNKRLLVPIDVALAILNLDFLYASAHGISLNQYMSIIDNNWPVD